MNPDEPQVPSLSDPLVQAAIERIMDDGELSGQLDEVHRHNAGAVALGLFGHLAQLVEVQGRLERRAVL